ncbi:MULTISPECIES: carbamoyl-phosphate synthase large subunit [unclassified Sphingobium]|uniref:carbamoyl-phosphate synthase large subunit n=1 Tax=unclassified Sphingobium TaxID=2611147 RepID=UPI000D165B32|nr:MULTISPECIES: carbamoyl-phosphate synthase large subunit [unclassified Sphingobium]MBG6117099.1 carbamoyl-phosphate synthase large subunit [Sphingobium sp. JAI105]PSO11343.1 carbamoyl phosphate synthase large subunit [Sphingobium sp. AEW4]TWD12693.1 carbamoyl-phosphate synthase large subunit [Sphingobium sp. AEW010]TWD30464.1 carbamoyl-phosphate synthase large subunit [Sphingobium sp. AEW013]TWD30781.1 carbamoyl-phosphate synthase large subunit [Sphingobium sp. AEW001]
MPKRTDISSILIIGAGPIIIGQACEFDYSGTQAVKALKEEGYRIILVNSNPATIMTDPEFADATYVEPITPEIVAKIIEKERPDAVLPTMGGQTALNTALALFNDGTLEKFGVQMIGADAEAIDKAEDRIKFRDAMDKIGLESARSRIAHSMEEALEALEFTGLPSIIRPSFTMGGTGGGIAYNRDEFMTIVRGGLDASPTTEVLIEESLLGWKEYEMEVVRDRNDNCIIICSIENVDPMGVHTGDSITVAPALTLTDKEYQIMRNASIAVLREIGVETGGSNVQFAVNPKDGRLIVIEMNPRVSRSSALASKATGFPIAKVAAKLAVGYTLDEITNDITGATPASFEPTIDYVVTKIPRFAFEKFKGAEPLLGTAMKSVGEVMAIGRNIHESMQKALRGLETGLCGFNDVEHLAGAPKDDIVAALSQPTPDRLLVAAQALREGLSVSEIHNIAKFDPWFLERIKEIIDAEGEVLENGLPRDADGMRRLKSMGFSDKRLAYLALKSANLRGMERGIARGSGLIHEAVKAMTGGVTEDEVRALRHKLGVRPVFKRIDTCAAEFEAKTPYMYSTYEAPIFGEAENESAPTDREKVVILGGGPNRIGQGIEFDYCCVHACFALSDVGYETIMVNCNPETVSTDYDTSDRLYFEPLTAEDVLEILDIEKSNGTLKGVIVQFGGQTPLKLAQALEDAGIPILGTSPDAIDLAEDRERFAALIDKLKLRQPANGIARSREEAIAVANRIGYPVLMRPSYVLGGRAMEIVDGQAQLEEYITTAVLVSGESPVLIDQYLRDAIEVDVDALCDGADVVVAGVLQHIEEAGVHSGDSACSLPPYSLSNDIIAEIERQTEILAHALSVRGLMNIQFAVKDGTVYLIEVNPRASRTVPFVAKAIGTPIAKIAARVMAGEMLETLPTIDRNAINHVAVKEAVFPFGRFPGVDPVLSPEMKSTGEVMGIDSDFATAFAKAQIGAGTMLPTGGTVFISLKDGDKQVILPAAKKLAAMGFRIIATGGTATFLANHGIAVETVNKVAQGRPHIVDRITDGDVQLIFNTTEGWQSLKDSKAIRTSALRAKIASFTTAAASVAAADAIEALRDHPLEVRSLQSYYPLSQA